MFGHIPKIGYIALRLRYTLVLDCRCHLKTLKDSVQVFGHIPKIGYTALRMRYALVLDYEYKCLNTEWEFKPMCDRRQEG